MDTEEAVKKIEAKLRIGKLDSLLLFISSSLSLVFAIMQIIIGGYNSIIFFIPLLFLGWFMPVYIGYLRGAILLDSVVERIRGWLYLVIGAGFYISLIPISLLRTLQQAFGAMIGIIFALLVSLVIFSIIIICYSPLKKALFKITDHSMDEETKKAISYTVTTVSILGAVSFFIQSTFWESFSIYFLIPLIIYASSLIYFEGKARYWSKRVEEARKQKESNKA